MIQVYKKKPGNVKCNKTITALHFVQYDVFMEHWKAILTKARLGQCYLSVLHNTSYCTKWSAIIVLLHLTFPVFFVYQDQFLENVCWFFFKFKSTWAYPFNIIDTCTNSVCTNQYYLFSVCKFMCTHLYMHSACIFKTAVPLSVCVCVTSLQRTLKTFG